MLFNVYGHLNAGDGMLVETTIALLSKTKLKFQIEGIAYDPETERRWNPNIVWHERVGNKGPHAFWGRGLQVLYVTIAILISISRLAWPLRHLLPSRQRTGLESLAGASMAISCPGGYFEDSNSAYFLNVIQVLLAHRMCGRVVMAPQSVGPIRGAFGRRVLRYALKRADRIFVRESNSLQFLEEIFGAQGRSPPLGGRIAKTGDLAFWFQKPELPLLHREAERLGIRSDRKLLGLTLVNWSFPNSASVSSSREGYLSAMCELVDHVESRGTHQIIVFNQVLADLEITKELHRRRPTITVDEHVRSCSMLAGLIGLSDVFVGTRFHSCIFALLEAVPTCAVSYLPKTDGIMEEIGLSEFVLEIDSLKGWQLIQQFDNLVSSRARYSEAIREKVDKYRDRGSSFVEYLSEY